MSTSNAAAQNANTLALLSNLGTTLFGSKAKTTQTTSGGTETKQTMLSKEAIEAMLRTLMESDKEGLARIASGAKTPGMYNTTSQTLLVNDLLARTAGQVAERSAPTVTTKEPTTVTTMQKIPPAGGGGLGLTAGALLLSSKGARKKLGLDEIFDDIGSVFGGKKSAGPAMPGLGFSSVGSASPGLSLGAPSSGFSLGMESSFPSLSAAANFAAPAASAMSGLGFGLGTAAQGLNVSAAIPALNVSSAMPGLGFSAGAPSLGLESSFAGLNSSFPMYGEGLGSVLEFGTGASAVSGTGSFLSTPLWEGGFSVGQALPYLPAVGSLLEGDVKGAVGSAAGTYVGSSIGSSIAALGSFGGPIGAVAGGIIGKAVSKLCFITTAVCSASGKPDDCYELQTLRQFRDTWMAKNHPELIAQYYAEAPGIVSTIDKMPEAARIYATFDRDFIQPAVAAIESGDNERALQIYTSLFHYAKGIANG